MNWSRREHNKQLAFKHWNTCFLSAIVWFVVQKEANWYHMANVDVSGAPSHPDQL